MKEQKLLSINEKSLARDYDLPYEILDKAFDAKTVFIKKKGKVIAKAQWQGWDLVVTKVRRPAATTLKQGDMIYKEPELPKPAPPKPELKTQGHLLIRNTEYSSRQAIRQDPFWEEYQGWFIIPQKINNRDGLECFLEDYPELGSTQDAAQNKLQTQEADDTDTNSWKMAKFSEVDDYVCGYTDKKPALIDYSPPQPKEMIDYTANYCPCGCGAFEHYSMYWPNKWIVYIPRKK